ncbi:MAG: hypothetical protein KDA05_11170 [Phycisphaerales bacterium]|nr:hypothetical protein [Phycisphaerales bacterium]
MAIGPMLDSGALTLVLAVGSAGALGVWRVLSGVIESHTGFHDTKVKVAQLQIKYLARGRQVQVGEVEDQEPIEVGAPEDQAPPAAAA